MYHRVAEPCIDPWGLCVSPEHFLGHLELLARKTDIVPLDDFRDRLRMRRGSKAVVAITFDDGYEDNLLVAAPLLRRLAAPATVFLATGYIGQDRPYWWDELSAIVLTLTDAPAASLRLDIGGAPFLWPRPERITGRMRDDLHRGLWERLVDQPESSRQRVLGELRAWRGPHTSDLELAITSRPLSEGQVRELVADSLVTIGAHTHSHSRLSRRDSDAKLEDVRRSRDVCARLTGSLPKCFAYPNGDLDEDSVRIIGSLGFELACTSHQDLVWPSTDPFRTPRISVGDWSAAEFERRLFGYWLN
jgi:peptidoglycan/xylan/chitin deacetylase (PgdA/CDA1 family)